MTEATTEFARGDRPTALGVFIFAGGFTYGVKQAGFDVLAQLEDGPYGVATTRRNHKGLPVHTDPDRWPLGALKGKVDFAFGNPPCAPFSNAGVSNKKVGLMDNWWRMDERAKCVTEFFRVLEEDEPLVWAWESVQPALKRGLDLVNELTVAAQARGYQASYVLENGVHLGVAQTRRRVFVVFHKVAIDWMYPEPGKFILEWTGPESFLQREVPKTVREAWEPITSGRLADPELAGGEVPRRHRSQYGADLLSRLKPGGSLKRVWEAEHDPSTYVLNAQGKVKGRPGFLYKRLAWDGVSPTLTGSAAKTFHPDLDRYITVLEKQLLCGYPEDYVFEGPPINQLAQVAQAVMPPVGEWLARNVMAAIKRGAPADPTVAAVVDLEAAWAAKAPAVAPRPKASRPANVTEPVSAPLRPAYESVRPAQASTLPLWDEFSGPTAIARALIADGHGDGAILATTAEAIKGAKAANATVDGKPWPHLFTSTDLKRLRARLERDAAAKGDA